MDSSIVCKARIVMAPQAVNAVGFLYACGDHLGIVQGREIVWNVQHYITYNTTDRGKCVWSDVFERVFVGGRVFKLWILGLIDFKGDTVTPIDLARVSMSYFKGEQFDDLPASTLCHPYPFASAV